MSHFSVLVVGEDIEKALAPFQENNMGDCPKKYLKFNNCSAEVSADWKKLTKAEKEKYGSKLVFAKDYYGYKPDKPGGSRLGYWENPNKKWDWYQVGGRYAGRLTTLEGAICDSVLRGQLDLAAMTAKRRAEAVGYWAGYEKDIRKGDPKFARYLHGVEEGETFEAFQERIGRLSAFAVLRDGKWYERGEMGWWGCVSDEKDRGEWEREFEKLVAEVPPETRLTIVDCHI